MFTHIRNVESVSDKIGGDYFVIKVSILLLLLLLLSLSKDTGSLVLHTPVTVPRSVKTHRTHICTPVRCVHGFLHT